MTAIPATSRASGFHGASMLLLGLAAALVLIDAVVVVLTGALVERPGPVITWVLAMAGMAVAGAVLVRDRRHAGLARLALGVAATGGLVDVMGALPEVGPFGFLAAFASGLLVALLVHLVVRWPDRRIGGPVAKALVVAAYAVPAALTAGWQLTWDARWFEGAAADRWWLTLAPARDVSFIVFQTQQIVLVALVLAVLALLVVRVAAADGARRRALAPVAVVAVVLGATDLVQVLVVFGAPIALDVDVLQNLALLAVPVAVLATALRSPALVDAPAAPGRRLHIDDAARQRYRLGLAGAAGAIVVVVAVAIGVSSGVTTDTPPAPQPGPALVAP